MQWRVWLTLRTVYAEATYSLLHCADPESWVRCVGGAGMPKGGSVGPPRSRVQGGGAAAPPRRGREGRRPVGLGHGGARPLGHKRRAQPFHRGTRLSTVAMVTGWPRGGRGPPAPAAPVLAGHVWRVYSVTRASCLWNVGACRGVHMWGAVDFSS